MLTLGVAPATQSAELSVPTGILIGHGYGSNVDVNEVQAHWDSFYQNNWLKDRGLDTRLSADLESWRSRRDGDPHGSVVAVGLTPLVRWWANREGIAHTYLEGGIGVRLLSHTQIDERKLSLAAEFGERIAAGLAFGPQDRYEVGVFLQHTSNGRLKQPNNGLSFFGLSLRMGL